MGDALDEEALHLGAFEDDAHDKVVDVLVLDEFAAVVGGQLLQAVDLGHDCDQELHEDADLVDDILELLLGQAVEVAAEVAVDGLQESSIGMLLEHLRPLQEQLQRLPVLLPIDLLAVDDIDLRHQRAVLFHVVLERFSQVLLAFLFPLGQVGLVLQDEAGIPDLFF